MSSNNSATSGDERIETQGLVRDQVVTSRETLSTLHPVTLRNGRTSLTNETINGTELKHNSNPIFNSSGKKSTENDTDSSEDRIDTAV